MIRFALIIFFATSLSACNNSGPSRAEKQETSTETPCDSLALEMFDDAGNPYVAKVPCDTVSK